MEATSSVALGRAVQLAGNPALRFSGCSGRCWCEMCDVVGVVLQIVESVAEAQQLLARTYDMFRVCPEHD